MRLETCIRKGLRLKSHRVREVHEEDGRLVAEIEAMPGRLLICGTCPRRTRHVHDRSDTVVGAAVVCPVSGRPGAGPGPRTGSHQGRSVHHRARGSRSCVLSCSLTSCCDWLGESPNDGKFPVRPSSLIPDATW